MTTSEEWRDVVGWEGFYEVSNLGEVRSVSGIRVNPHTSRSYRVTGKILIGRVNRGGYRQVLLAHSQNVFTRTVHKLVAEAFLPNPNNHPMVLHGPNGKLDNSTGNLRWGTAAENAADSVQDGTHPEARKTHCPHGHPYDKRNTLMNSGHRKCRQCVRTRSATRYWKLRNEGIRERLLGGLPARLPKPRCEGCGRYGRIETCSKCNGDKPASIDMLDFLHGGEMTEATYLVWDAETGGIDVHEDRIVQWFMATADEDGNLIDTYQCFINPGIPIAQESIDVHGLTNEWLAENGKDPWVAFTEIRDTFLRHLELTHVAFNMAFDLSILDVEFKRHGVTDTFGVYMRDNAKLIDSIVLDRHFDRFRKGKRTLAAQATHYDVPYDEEALHDARADVELTAKVTARIVERYGTATTKEQSEWYAEWAESFEKYLRKTDPDAVVDRDWPIRLKED